MDEKLAFIRDWESGRYYKNSLCEYYGISRPAADRLIKRYELEGMDFLLPRSRRPHNSPNTTDAAVVAKIMHWRKGGRGIRSKVTWGARKIRVKLLEDFAAERVPSTTSIHNILVRPGAVEPRKKKRRSREAQRPRYEADRSNEIISADYKGYRFLGNGRKCYPLTIFDNYSRFIFTIQAAYRESSKDVIAAFTKLFREYGLPEHVLTDNGSPFSSAQSPCGYGLLSYFLIDHGVTPLFIDPGCPTQNTFHERTHRDLEAECFSPPSNDLRWQSRRFNTWSHDFNWVRPHEGLDMKTPGSVYECSSREFKEKVRSWEYPSDVKVRKVYENGVMRWGSYEWVTITRSLAGKYVGVKRIGNRSWEIHYRQVCLGQFTEGEEVINGQYYRLTSQLDLPEKYRDWKRRERKK